MRNSIRRSCFLFAAVASYAFLADDSNAGDLDEPPSLVNAFSVLKEEAKALKTVHAEGTLEVETSPDLQKFGTPKSYKTKYEIWAKGDKIKVELVAEDGGASSFSKRILLLSGDNFDSIIYKSSVFALVGHTSDPIFSQMSDTTFPFLAYSFLAAKSDAQGITALPLQEIGDSGGWADVTGSAPKAKVVIGSGRLTLQIQAPLGRWEVVFPTLPDVASGSLKPAQLDYYMKLQGQDKLMRHVVIEAFGKGLNNPIVTKATMVSYILANPADPSSYVQSTTDRFTLDKIEMNSSMDDSLFEFDPSTVDKIWDAKSNAFIDVPR